MRAPMLLLILAVGPAPALVAQGTPAAPAAARLDSAAALAAGRKYTEWFYGDMGDSLIAHSSQQVK
ncbi:MAG TPA: hypothetical protein VFV65_02115, partial [Gemmatimonadales bacterium]|nr:hypothetical protein [Gemmatimonadales bacterium]